MGTDEVDCNCYYDTLKTLGNHLTDTIFKIISLISANIISKRACLFFSFQQIEGLPSKLNSKKELCEFLSRLICHVTIQHTALNYELADYGSYVPDTPTKLYNDTRVKEGEFSVYRLPNRETAAVSTLVIFRIVFQAPVVRKADNAIHRINPYPVDSVVCFLNTYPLDSDLSGG